MSTTSPAATRRPSRLLASSMFALLAAAAPWAQAQQARPVSFSARLAFSEAVLPAAPGGSCLLIGHLSGSGSSSALGRVTASTQDCINARDAAATSFSFHNNQAPMGVEFIGESGDRLFARYSGTLTPRTGAPHRISGMFVITGGSGRYTGASGGGIVDGYEDISQPGAGRGEVSFMGVLSH